MDGPTARELAMSSSEYVSADASGWVVEAISI